MPVDLAGQCGDHLGRRTMRCDGRNTFCLVQRRQFSAVSTDCQDRLRTAAVVLLPASSLRHRVNSFGWLSPSTATGMPSRR